MFPEAGLTKLDIARHYERVAPAMLPYVRDRPLALQAFPDGIEGEGYFMKAVPALLPGLGQARHAAEEGRHDHARARRQRGDARVPGRPERRHRRTRGYRAPTSPTSPTA